MNAQQKSVLFIGNSYTYSNNFPDLFYQLSLSGGDSVIYDSYAPGGYTFQLHSQDQNTISKINQQNWDYVVLQGQSQQAALDTPYVIANVFPYARMLDSLIHDNDSCSQTVFFMTWGRKYGDSQFCSSYPPVCTYSGMQDQLRGRYLQMAYDNGAICAPAGVAWQNAIAAGFAPDLFSGDGSHPSLHGSYLTACVFYATLFRKTPVGLNYCGGLPQSEAQQLQAFAELIVMDSLNHWNAGVYYPSATLFYNNISGSSYAFQTTSGYASYFWDFGDGNTLNGGAMESHIYQSTGSFPVSVTVSNGCHETVLYDTVIVTTVGEEALNVSPFTMYPNPADHEITMDYGTFFQYEIKDASGRKIDHGSAFGKKSLNVAAFSDGLYLIKVFTGETTIVRRFIVKH
ncbi:MAG: hypothetical protein Fur0041_21140 [Bacteroidia bacterium]